MNLLHIDSSILGEHSASREIGAAWIDVWQQQHPDATVQYLDLAREPLAHLSGAVFAARNAATHDAALQAEVDADRAALAQFLAADVVVIGAPMYNFSIPSQLKAWIDRVVVAGETFRYGANGPEGLVKNKKAVLVISRGGVYSAGPASAMDFQESYLRAVLGFIGITEIEVIRAEGLAHGAAQRSAALEQARRAIAQPLPIAA